MPALIDRYIAGEFEEVWTELISFDSMTEESVQRQASLVARETMVRVRRNLETIVARLESIGYCFGRYDEETAAPDYVGPLAELRSDWHVAVMQMQEAVGALPTSLLAFYQIVGGVDFTGYHAEWLCDYPDPLVVFALDPDAAIEEYRDRTDWNRREDKRLTYQYPIAPDDYHKANVSGGPPYAIELPNPAVDALLLGERHATTFVQYLRICLRWGGFPGLERCSHSDMAESHRQYLTEGLVPF